MSILIDGSLIDGNVIDAKSIRALAIDLDGTALAPGAVLNDRTIRAVKSCIQRGIQIIITTGRAIEATESYRLLLGAKGPMVYYNGAVVADMPGNKILSATLLDKEIAKYCLELSREMGVYYQVYFPGDYFPGFEGRIFLASERKSPEYDFYYKHTGIVAEFGDLEKALEQPGLTGCIKGMFLVEPEFHEIIRKKVTGRFGDNVYIVQTLRNFLEVMHPNVSKGSGLAFIMERCSLGREEVIAFGDEENDLPMFSVAAFSAAPSNARDSVKAKASFVIGSNAEDGLAAFLEDFFGLIPSV